MAERVKGPGGGLGRACYPAKHDLVFWRGWGRCFEVALAVIESPEPDRSAADRVWRDRMDGDQLLEIVGTLDAPSVDQDLVARMKAHPDTWCAAEILRVHAENLLSAGSGNAETAAEAVLRRSLKIACDQGALAWELRIAMSLARLRRRQQRTREGLEALSAVLDRFTEGFATADVVSAHALIDALKTDDIAA